MNIKPWRERADCDWQAEIDELRAALKAQADDPEFDGIENANPAWWRGHWHSAEVFCQKVNEILDGKDDGSGVGNPPWEPTRRRLLALKAQPVQEPAGYAYEIFTENACNGKKTWQFVMGRSLRHDAPIRNVDKLYTTLVAHPVQPAPLTDELLWELFYENAAKTGFTTKETYTNFARAVEARVRTGGAG